MIQFVHTREQFEMHFDPAGLEKLFEAFHGLLRDGRASLSATVDEAGLFFGRLGEPEERHMELSVLPREPLSSFEKRNGCLVWCLDRDDAECLSERFDRCRDSASFGPGETIDVHIPGSSRRLETLYGFYDIPVENAVRIPEPASPGWTLYEIRLEQGVFGRAVHEPGVAFFVKGKTREEVLSLLRQEARKLSRNPYFRKLFRKSDPATNAPAPHAESGEGAKEPAP